LLAAMIFGGFLLYFRFARGGIAMRATASDPQTAMSIGINAPRSYAATWVLSALTATVAGHSRRDDDQRVPGSRPESALA
jgi:branched-chain amino acid transport system permease protein